MNHQRTKEDVVDNRATNVISLFAACLIQIALFDSLFTLNGNKADDGGFGRQILWGGLGLTAMVYIAIDAVLQRDSRISFGGWPVFVLLVYVFSSTMWSVTPESTLKRCVIFLFVILLASIAVGSRSESWNSDEFSRSIGMPVALLIGLSMLLTIFVPGRVFTDIGWRGIAGQKNEAGQFLAIAILLLLYGIRTARVPIYRRLALLLVCSLFFALAQSTTALLGLAFSLIICEAVTLRSSLAHAGSWNAALMGCLLMLCLAGFVSYQLNLIPESGDLYAQFLRTLGKSETLTGRTAIWNLVLGESRFHNSMIGGGYGGFWVGPQSISGYVRIGDGLYPGQAHNGYIDVYNDLGYTGLAILFSILTVALYRIRQLFALRHPEAKLHLAIVLVCIVLNLGESTFFRNSQFMNIVFFMSFIRVFSIIKQAGTGRAREAM